MTPLERIYKEVNARVNNAHELPDGTKDKDFQLGEDSAYAFVLGLIEELQEQEPQGLDGQPKRKLRKVCNLREDLKADKPIEERLEELRQIRAEKDRLDEAAGEYMEHIPESEPELMDSFYDWEQMEAAFKAGAKWRDAQMKVPNSTELIAEWHEVKDILKEKDFRGDQWRLAYQAFMFGFSRGLNTKK